MSHRSLLLQQLSIRPPASGMPRHTRSRRQHVFEGGRHTHCRVVGQHFLPQSRVPGAHSQRRFFRSQTSPGGQQTSKQGLCVGGQPAQHFAGVPGQHFEPGGQHHARAGSLLLVHGTGVPDRDGQQRPSVPSFRATPGKQAAKRSQQLSPHSISFCGEQAPARDREAPTGRASHPGMTEAARNTPTTRTARRLGIGSARTRATASKRVSACLSVTSVV